MPILTGGFVKNLKQLEVISETISDPIPSILLPKSTVINLPVLFTDFFISSSFKGLQTLRSNKSILIPYFLSIFDTNKHSITLREFATIVMSLPFSILLGAFIWDL